MDLRRIRSHPDVVAVERDVQDPDRHLRPLDPTDLIRQPARQIVATVGDADQHHVCRALVSLQDLVSDPGERPPDVVGLHDLGAQKGTPPRASREADGSVRIFDSLPGLAGPA